MMLIMSALQSQVTLLLRPSDLNIIRSFQQDAAQKKKFSIKNFFSKCEQI